MALRTVSVLSVCSLRRGEAGSATAETMAAVADPDVAARWGSCTATRRRRDAKLSAKSISSDQVAPAGAGGLGTGGAGGGAGGGLGGGE
eukprot:4031841-Prymnesium_polylepis.1